MCSSDLMILTTVWMGAIGFLDDYIKVFRKNKEGLHGRFKILGQVVLGLIVGAVILWHPDVQVREYDTWYHYEMQDGEPVGDFVLVQRADSVLTEGLVLESGLTAHTMCACPRPPSHSFVVTSSTISF